MVPRLLTLLALLLSGCGATYVATARPFKGAVRPICISKTDQMSEGTASQIEADDLAIAKLTGERCPKRPPH